MSGAKLLPCPFCGAPAQIDHMEEGDNAGGSCVSCSQCLASSNVEFGFKENFIANWNRRVVPPSGSATEPSDVDNAISNLAEACIAYGQIAASNQTGTASERDAAWGRIQAALTRIRKSRQELKSALAARAPASPDAGGREAAAETPPAAPAEREALFERISEELDRAYSKHGRDPWGRHEFYAILLEEVDELWEAIKRDEPQERVYAELVQVAAMCFRYVETGDRYPVPVPGKEGE